jgi:cell division protein FtsL
MRYIHNDYLFWGRVLLSTNTEQRIPLLLLLLLECIIIDAFGTLWTKIKERQLFIYGVVRYIKLLARKK